MPTLRGVRPPPEVQQRPRKRAAFIAAVTAVAPLCACGLLPPSWPPATAKTPSTPDELAASFEKAGISVEDERTVEEYLEQEYGMTCVSISNSFGVYDGRAFDAEIAAARLSEGWLDDHRWVGRNPGELAREVGADAVVLSRGVWLVIAEPQLHALEVRHVATPEGNDVWAFEDNVSACDSPAPSAPRRTDG